MVTSAARPPLHFQNSILPPPCKNVWMKHCMPHNFGGPKPLPLLNYAPQFWWPEAPPPFYVTAGINHSGFDPIASSTHCPDCVTNNILATISYYDHVNKTLRFTGPTGKLNSDKLADNQPARQDLLASVCSWKSSVRRNRVSLKLWCT